MQSCLGAGRTIIVLVAVACIVVGVVQFFPAESCCNDVLLYLPVEVVPCGVYPPVTASQIAILLQDHPAAFVIYIVFGFPAWQSLLGDVAHAIV